MNTCFFCGRQTAHPASSIELPVYQLTRYAHLGIARRFEFNKMIIPIDRCTECEQAHLKMKKNRQNRIVIGAVLGFIIGVPIPGAFIFTAIIGGVIGHFSARTHAKKYYARIGIIGADTATLSTHPMVHAKLSSGWTLKKPGG